MTAKILKVLDIELSIQESHPPNLVVEANGEVTTGGWSNGRLLPYIYINPPKDGIYEFDFVGDPPNGSANLMHFALIFFPQTTEANYAPFRCRLLAFKAPKFLSLE